jgi:Ni,Fe-hydrogenase III small subunit
MVKLWVLRGLKTGIVTTKYPRRSPTDEEAPPKCLPPAATETSDWERGEEICPTGAIQRKQSPQCNNRIDLGKCIYCQRCSKAGFVFADSSSREGSLTATFGATSATEEIEGKPSDDKLFQRYAKQWSTNIFKRSFHILMIDVGSCNACNLEVLNLSNPYYDLNRLGIFFTNSPKHADALIVVGALNRAMVDVLKRTYESIPNPKIVIAVGACPISGGVFQSSESFVSPVRDLIPVGVVIPGCPPSPIQILQGLLIAMGKLKPLGSPIVAKTESPIAPQIKED